MKMSKKAKTYLFILVFTGLVFSYFYWSSHRNYKMDITGTIVDIPSELDESIAIHLKEDLIPGVPQVYGEAMVFISDQTMIYIDNKEISLTSALFRTGMRVEVKFTGPVAESYPVQAEAKVIRILTTP
ncbi:MAG: DUF3221 domain-containing protein [Clostridiaceae bacterium]